MSNATANPDDQPYVYAIGIGSNRPLTRVLDPKAIATAALTALDTFPLRLLAGSPIIATRPLGPSMRTYANAAALVSSPLQPIVMLNLLQQIERRFGRRRHRRWAARTLDLDILLWSAGSYASKRLTVPHSALKNRSFALAPLRMIAPRWRHPASKLSVIHLAARLAKPKPVDHCRARL
ncbi:MULTISPECIES: 2-amino-4-hydroxy-6-hydroxymethyldihydropteridine diphosphokinase [Sphingobium]|uniref:2-amino-4-hydroxy-6- hydroxymethyldihydropteridine diphosphokinase n=1 Tax=Sphingobium TaxID=165695 RepID=UPI0015EC90DA|nr:MULTISPECIES: 2-amino-4-hydroxy-6-hydroxymethyldihydropteridine diphosphokinase [Sphingobium]